MKAAVIGGGIFGTLTALRLAERGHDVTLFERLPRLHAGATGNANRLHMGFHYPRDDETARQCLRGYPDFKREFREALIPGPGTCYFIASEGSLTTPDEFVAFCDRVGLGYRVIDVASFRPEVRNVSFGIRTDETYFDPDILRRLMAGRLAAAGVDVRVDTEVAGLARNGAGTFVLGTGNGDSHGFDVVVNCSYANVNRLSAQLGRRPPTYRYEYTAAALIQLDWPEPVSATVIDGPFSALIPFTMGGGHLLYHVEHSVVAASEATLLDPGWLDPPSAPFDAASGDRWFAALRDRAARYMPLLAGARFIEVREGPRVVLANRDATDTRPSVIAEEEPGYLTVLSGKVDHAMWVAGDVADRLSAR